MEGKGRMFASAKEAIETYRAETGCIDQDLPAFVVARDGKPVAKIANGDSVILFNFRGDRAQEISLAFDRKEFDHFDRGDYTGVKFAGMLQYLSLIHIWLWIRRLSRVCCTRTMLPARRAP